jgi:hypothetical protein
MGGNLDRTISFPQIHIVQIAPVDFDFCPSDFGKYSAAGAESLFVPLVFF